MPPGAGYRPNSAPPPNWRPPQQTYPRPGQFPPGFAGPGKPNTWPSQARPATPAEQAQWFGRPSVPQQRPAPPALPVAAPVPGKINPAPTMHFDTKTGKWQSNMLPAEMQPNARPRGMSASAGDGVRDPRRTQTSNPTRTPVPTASTPSLALVRARRDSSESSGSCSTCSGDEGMAYGNMYSKNGMGVRRVVSHERRRPSQSQSQNQSTRPVELDWYATQISQPPLPARTQTSSKIGTGPSPSMAQVLLNRGDRANSLPISANARAGAGYSASQPNLLMPVELDSRSLPLRQQQQQQQMQSQRTASPRMEVLELDGREKGYRAYSGRPS